MKIVIAGGSGLVGSSLEKHMTGRGHAVHILSRSAKDPLYRWDPEKGVMNSEALDDADVIVNLTGASVAGKRWTTAYKQEMRNSRLSSAKTLGAALQRAVQRKRIWIQASGVGFYPNSDARMTEDMGKGNDFLANLCAEWEDAAFAQHSENTSVAVMRFGIVLKQGEGFLGKLVPVARWGLSAAFGNGKQHISWIYISDLTGIMNHIIENHLEGIYNAVADEVVTNRQMTAAIARSVHRPFFLPAVPAWFLRLLFGEMGSELLSNHNVSNQKIKQAGYAFEQPVLEGALERNR